MIYQCYFRRDQEPCLFTHEPYAPFGLEPEVNEIITTNCPELATKENRLRVQEYAAMLWHWRNPLADGDSWIGFTSYRQLEKGYPFVWRDKAHVESILADCDVASWGLIQLPMTLSQQAELSHPGINECMGQLLYNWNITVPREYHTATEGVFASYWAMRRELFNEWMEWLYPKLAWCLRHTNQPYLRANPKWHVLERLFIVWYMMQRKQIGVVGRMENRTPPPPDVVPTAESVAAAGNRPVVVLVQPLYGPCPARHHGRLCQFIAQNINDGRLHWYNPFVGAYIDEACNRLVADTLDNIPEATHVLFVEQDMVLPAETLEALLSAGKDVISATYCYKDADATLVAFGQLGPPGEWLADEEFVEDEVQQVAGVGVGCLLVTTDLLRRMEARFGDRLWFQCQQITNITQRRPDLLDACRSILRTEDKYFARDNGAEARTNEEAENITALRTAIEATDEDAAKVCKRTKGQDWHFCKRCETMGVPVFLDGRVWCGHLVDGEMTRSQWEAARERKKDAVHAMSADKR